MPSGLRANNVAAKIFKKIMGIPAPLEKDFYKKKKRKQSEWVQTLPGSSSPNGIGPIF